MTERERRLHEKISDPAYLEGLDGKSLDELKAMREECREAETELSFERRLCQARVDILGAELERRSGGGGDLVSRLPQILSGEMGGGGDAPLPSRAPDFSIPRNADVPRRRVEELVGEQTLARLGQISVDEIKGIIDSIAEHEKGISTRRRNVQEIMDQVQAAMVPKFKAMYPMDDSEVAG